MSEQSHTPGPWECVLRHNPMQADWVIDTEIGMIKPPLSMSRIEIEANARLIAAAPELLEACRQAERWLMLNATDACPPLEVLTDAITKALGQYQALEAKAKGGAQ